MRENYWVDREITIEKISNQVTVYGISTTFLTEPEFKAKLKNKIQSGIGGILIGAAAIFGGYLTEKYIPPENNPNYFFKLIYVIGGVSAVSGGKKTYDYFRHRNDKKPNSHKDAIDDIVTKIIKSGGK